MRIVWALMLISLAGAGRLAVAAPEMPQAPAPEAPGKDLQSLVRDLADDNFRVRERASRELWDRGEAALPALQEALHADDPEQVFRARELIRRIQLHITPDTDPAVQAMVERYSKASPTEKIALFARMRAKHAWRQMLKLYSSEPRGEIRTKLQPAIKGVALKAARERLYQGDAREAGEFLEMAPADAEGLLALADYHRSQGTLADALERARQTRGHKSQAWQLALQRAAGDLPAAREAAIACGEVRVAAAMAALAGDPLPWLRDVRDTQADEPADPVAVAYAAAAARRWQGQKLRPSDLAPFTRGLGARSFDERFGSLNAMFLLGEVTSAEKAFVKAAPLAAFRYFEALERIPEALEALGLDPQHPDYRKWVETQLQNEANENIEDQREPSDTGDQILAIATFLERRGLHELAEQAFAEPLAKLAVKDEDAFTTLLGKLIGGREPSTGAPRLAGKIAAHWAGDDPARWDQCLIAFFGEDEPVRDWWEWLADLDPQASRPQRLDALLAMLGLGTDPGHLREKWTARAWAQVAAAPEAKRKTLLGYLSSLALVAGDVASSLKAWDLLPDPARKEIFWGEHILHLSAAERWDETAAVFLNQIDQAKTAGQETNIQFHAYAAAALRQAGREAEAAVQDRWADQLVLGNAAIAIQIGNGYAFGRDYARAAEWWARATRLAEPGSEEFAAALRLHADALLEQDQWRTAASVVEIICRLYAGADFRGDNPLPLMHQRLTADTAHALAMLKDDRAGALALLGKCHKQFTSDGSLADLFFPALRKAGLIKEHDAWFAQTWALMEQVIERYPDSDNTRNTAAWFAARARRQLDAAQAHLQHALDSDPCQAAYLDTMAEIQFAKGNREQALVWSRTAMNYQPSDLQLRRQQQRFRTAPLPD